MSRTKFLLSETTKYTELGTYDANGRRAVFAARLRHDLTRETHVVVGDHAPERRVNHDACDSGDGSSVAQCKGAACKSHDRCCWQ